MKSIKLLLAIAALFMTTALFGQAKVSVTSSKNTFVQTETGSTTLFTCTGTETEISNLQNRANALKDKMTLEMEKNKNGSYTCKLVVNHQPQAEYAVKMLTYLGISTVTVDGKEKPVADLSADLNAMKEK